MSSKTNGGRGPRTVALVGPYGSGKTTLLESILFVTGAAPRKGSVSQSNTVGDSSPEARARQMSVEINCATTSYLDDSFTFIDCPGSIEFLQDALYAIQGVDAAVVVVEPEPAKVQMLKPYLKRLADLKIPHFMFVNKIDKVTGSFSEFLQILQDVSDTPLLLRQMPTWENGVATGFVDLALERAFAYRDHAPSEAVEIADKESEKEARFAMLEKLADYDEHLMEELLSDVEPPREEVFGDLSREFADCLVVPILIGSAEGDHGIRRLLKALRHEVPGVSAAAARMGLEANGDAVVQVLKTIYSAHGGKLSLSRVMNGSLKDGALLHTADGREARVGGIFALVGAAQTKLAEVKAGDTAALVRLEGIMTGDLLTSGKTALPKRTVELLAPVYRLAIEAADRKDEVKLTAAIGKLCEEDPSLIFEQNAELREMALAGQGEIHLKVSCEKMVSKYGLKLNTHPARVPYKETIRKSVTQRGRHKRQSGGHGQFGDCVIEIKPQPRGAGFIFVDEIVGGVVPKQFIPSVEKGVRESLARGVLAGYPMIDIHVTLTGGSFHEVDSSEMAFQIAASMGAQAAARDASPVLLEPVMAVEVLTPDDFTGEVMGNLAARRGRVSGMEGRGSAQAITAEVPLSAMFGYSTDVRSMTQGRATYTMQFARYAPVPAQVTETMLERMRGA